jgi:hypothetical protein
LVIDVEITLAPCTKVIYNEFYRVVLEEIVSKWSKDGVGVSQYELYISNKRIRSKGRLNRAIKDLSACGYVVCVLREAKTRSPMGRKECYPTPLGILVHLLTSLLDKKIADVATLLAMNVAYDKLEEAVLRCLPRIYRYLDYMDIAHRRSLYPNLDRGYAAVIHVLSVLRLHVLSPLRTPAVWSQVPDSYVEVFTKELQPSNRRKLRRELEDIIDDLEGSLEYLDKSIREMREVEEMDEAFNRIYDMIHDLVANESLPPKPPKKSNIHSSYSYELKLKDIYKQIAEAFKLVQRALEVHEKL